jgi:ribonuclease HI
MGLGTDQCDYCRDSIDTVLHALRDCPLIRPLWITVVDSSLRNQFFSCNLQEWISLNVSNRSGISGHEDWSCFWAMGCHLAWIWRNKERYDEDFIRPIKQTEFVRQRLDSYKVADRVMQASCYQPRSTVDIGWKPPIAGWVCLNIDGACNNGIIGCGGVIRGNEGEWLHGFSKFIGRGDAYIAELWGVFEGIKLARRLNFSKVEVRTDSLGVVRDITNKKASQINGRALISRIGQMMDHDWEVVVKHVYREANQLADALAKHSFIVKDVCCFFRVCPDFCKHVLDADEKGSTTPRSVFV